MRLVRGVGLVAAVCFLAVRFPSWTAFATRGAGDLGGDLYQMVRVRGFREPMPPEAITPVRFGAAPESTRVLLVGDSHSRFSRGEPSLSERLHDSLPGVRLATATAIHPRFFDPVDMLRLEGIRPGGPLRTVILETAERAAPDVALGKIPQPFHSWDTTALFGLVQAGRNVKDRWFTGSEAGYQFLLLNSWATRGVAEGWNSSRFALGGGLPASIGAWTRDPPSLFLAEELSGANCPPGQFPTSFRQVRDRALVEAMANSFADAAARLRATYGADLVVLVVPAKASLLHDALGFPYDGFVPRLRAALASRGVRAIDSWSALSDLGEGAVLRTETHLSPRSYAVLADSLLAALREP